MKRRRPATIEPHVYPEAMRDLARRRCAPFLQHVLGFGRRLSLQALVESCYMQGLCDAADALSRGKREAQP